ncbi:MAG TPA: hypothetical protein ENG03_02635 [Thioploca sp.]|nr:MAG: hypothetical protein DRR08_18335 [Gammaproteobacteria bacterium]HDN25992.1 hypothetical protein [Thioploca sp.]
MNIAWGNAPGNIAEGTSPGKVVAFRPSETTKARVEDLICREKTTGLSSDETAELNQYLQLEHLMRLAKVRALGSFNGIIFQSLSKINR